MPDRRLMTSRKAGRSATGRRSREIRIGVGAEIRRLRFDCGLSQRRLAEMAGIDHGFLSLIERGLREPSLAVLSAVAAGLGGSLNVRIYPGTGPRIADPIQARIVESLVRLLDRRWIRFVEVPVYRPVRGVIDVVIQDRTSKVLVAIEVHSQIRRLEQLIRWANEKASALPSAELWQFIEPPRIERLLLCRSTRANREIAARFAGTLSTAYPASSVEAYAALTTPDQPWPGSAILWAGVDGDDARVLARSPRSATARL